MNNAYKSIITAILCVAILIHSKPEARSSLVGGICLIIFATVVAGCVVVTVKSCAPKWYCLNDPEANTTWSQQTTTRSAAINGYKIVGGPYDTETVCRISCKDNNDNTSRAQKLVALQNYEVYLQKSTNLVDWVTVATVTDDGHSGFEQSFTNSITEATVFYRAMEQ